MKRKATLLTHNDLELECLILEERPLITGGKEAIIYAQNRIVKGYIRDDDDMLVAEVAIVINFCIIPELEEELYEVSSNYWL